jgi:hypothetical protein
VTARQYLASWDCLGFEAVIDLTRDSQQRMLAQLADRAEPPRVPLPEMLLRARANPQRSPEIWIFSSEVDIETLRAYTKDNPHGLADLIREHGTKIFTTPREKAVIQ